MNDRNPQAFRLALGMDAPNRLSQLFGVELVSGLPVEDRAKTSIRRLGKCIARMLGQHLCQQGPGPEPGQDHRHQRTQGRQGDEQARSTGRPSCLRSRMGCHYRWSDEWTVYAVPDLGWSDQPDTPAAADPLPLGPPLQSTHQPGRPTRLGLTRHGHDEVTGAQPLADGFVVRRHTQRQYRHRTNCTDELSLVNVVTAALTPWTSSTSTNRICPPFARAGSDSGRRGCDADRGPRQSDTWSRRRGWSYRLSAVDVTSVETESPSALSL
jgi:hypothetical protein